uniref:Uncharacterized protein n=1 Tax=Helianthus annuus TaxID=4232 RepID=A0A251VDV3_HELAN
MIQHSYHLTNPYVFHILQICHKTIFISNPNIFSLSTLISYTFHLLQKKKKKSVYVSV